jgi:hypothetical protein
MYKKTKYCVYGESDNLKNSSLKKIFLSEQEAQDLACRVALYLKTKPATISYNKRKTTKMLAHTRELVIDHPTVKAIGICIYAGYNSVHIILHELAHTKNLYSIEDHGQEFTETFDNLIKMWNKKWNKIYL